LYHRQGCHHGLRWQSRPLTSIWPLVVTWATDIITDPSCSRTTDPVMVLSSGRPGWDFTMASSGRTVPCSSILRHPQALGWQLRSHCGPSWAGGSYPHISVPPLSPVHASLGSTFSSSSPYSSLPQAFPRRSNAGRLSVSPPPVLIFFFFKQILCFSWNELPVCDLNFFPCLLSLPSVQDKPVLR